MTLALDPGVRTGWARSDGALGTLDFTGRLWGEVSAEFSAWLADQISEHGVREIVYEQVFVRHQATELASGLVWDALRLAHLYELQIPRSVSPQARCKAVGVPLSRMPASERKRRVLEAVRARGWNAMNYHEADAVAVLLAHQARNKGAHT